MWVACLIIPEIFDSRCNVLGKESCKFRGVDSGLLGELTLNANVGMPASTSGLQGLHVDVGVDCKTGSLQ